MKKETPGTVLNALLKKHGLNYSSLAKAIGLSGAMVRLIALDENPVSAAVAFRLAAFFKMRPEYWLDLQTAFDIANTAKDKKLAKALKAIPTVDKAAKQAAKPGRKPKARKAAKKTAGKRGRPAAAKKAGAKKTAGKRGRPAAAKKAGAKKAKAVKAVKKPAGKRGRPAAKKTGTRGRPAGKAKPKAKPAAKAKPSVKPRVVKVKKAPAAEPHPVAPPPQPVNPPAGNINEPNI
jgi:addiction module HigA family antidote